jgi:D-lactate dehydrogenase
MRVAVFSTKSYDREFLLKANEDAGHELVFYEARLNRQTHPLAEGFPAVCAFVNDVLDAEVIQALSRHGTKLVAMRCAGFNNVDLRAAEEWGITVTRVPAYSPYAVAEHAVGLMLALNRRLYKAYNRVREGNFALEGLLGSDMHGQTVGIIGTGKIGTVLARIMNGFGCRLLAYDVVHSPEAEKCGARYVELAELFAESDIISLHCPLVPATYHLINRESIAQMKRGAMLVNTSRGALVDTREVIRALKSGQIGSLGIDVYEEEADLFFEDLSNRVIQDDVFSRMLTLPNVLITGHQAFFTRNALEKIARDTLANVTSLAQGQTPPGLVSAALVRSG